MQDFDELALALQPHYSHFNVANRLLFTGHSHQAWPDVAFAGIQEYMRVVADRVDTKWDIGFEKTEIMRNYLRDFYDDPMDTTAANRIRMCCWSPGSPVSISKISRKSLPQPVSFTR